MAPCLWWESENTRVYFLTSLFSVAPNCSIIVPNWVIWTWRFTAICFAVSIVTSLFTACATWAGLIDLQFLEFSAFFPFLILTLSGRFHADGSVWLHWGFLALRVYGFDLSCKIIVGSYFGPALYCWISGQVPLSVCLFRDLIAPSAWLILSSVDRVWLWLVDGLWRWPFWGSI